MLIRINFFEIISSHFKTLRCLGQRKGISLSDFLIFIITPLFSSVFLGIFNVELKSLTSDIITAISILAGFLFNLLAIIYTSIDKIKTEGRNAEDKKRFVMELHSNISYNILLSIFIIPFLLLYKLDRYDLWFDKVLLGINYFLLFSFFLTLLMVLKRIFILLETTPVSYNNDSSNNI